MGGIYFQITNTTAPMVGKHPILINAFKEQGMFCFSL